MEVEDVNCQLESCGISLQKKMGTGLFGDVWQGSFNTTKETHNGNTDEKSYSHLHGKLPRTPLNLM